jgi:hypothetical protein
MLQAVQAEFSSLVSFFRRSVTRLRIASCDIRVKHEIAVVNEAIRYKILLKLKVLNPKKLRGIP